MRARAWWWLACASVLALATCAKGGRSPVAAPTAPAPPAAALRWVTAEGGLTLRGEPTTEGVSQGIIPYGEQVEVVREAESSETIGGVTGRWTLVNWGGREAWVFGGYLASRAPAPPSPTLTEQFLWRGTSMNPSYYTVRYPGEGWQVTLQPAYDLQLELRRGDVVIDVPTSGKGIGEEVTTRREPRRIGPRGDLEAERVEYRAGNGVLFSVQYVTADWDLNFSVEYYGDTELPAGDIRVLDAMAATVDRVAPAGAAAWIADKRKALGFE